MRYSTRDLASGDIGRISRGLGSLPNSTTWAKSPHRDTRETSLFTQSQLLLETGAYAPSQLDTMGNLDTLFRGLLGASIGMMDDSDLNLVDHDVIDAVAAMGGPKMTRGDLRSQISTWDLQGEDGGSGSSVSFSQFGEGAVLAAQAAIAAGFRGEDLVTIVAIAGAESRYNPNNHNRSGNDDSYGFWQINLHGGLRSRLTNWNIGSPENLFDPFLNARCAYRLYRGRPHATRFGDWSVHYHAARRTQGDNYSNPHSNFYDIARQAVAQALGTVTGTSQAVPGQNGVPSAPNSAARRAVEIALSKLNDEGYRSGGNGPVHFDCSGLMVYAWREAAGVTIPRQSAAQHRAAVAGTNNLRAISRSQLRAGDLIFYRNRNNNTQVGHVAMYLDGTRVVEAAGSSSGIRIRSDGASRGDMTNECGRVVTG